MVYCFFKDITIFLNRGGLMDQQKIGEFIKNKRKEKELTQIELTDKLGITNQAISKWERGKNCPDIFLLKDLCKILDININELLSGKELSSISKEDTEDILVETATINSILTVRNPKGNPVALTITPLAGGTSPVSAHLIIIQLA